MSKQFIAVVFEGHDHNREVAMYDTADYCGASNDVLYQIRRNRDDCVVLMVPLSRLFYFILFYVKLVEDRKEI